MNLANFDKDRTLEDKFASTIKHILAEHFIHKITIDDLEKGRDFAIYNINPFSVAVRLRRYNFFDSFHDEFTIRWSRPSGAKTEIDKIRDGTVAYLFYGFMSPGQDRLIQYFLADLQYFGNISPIKIYENKPLDSRLAVYKITQFPTKFIVNFWRESKELQNLWKLSDVLEAR